MQTGIALRIIRALRTAVTTVVAVQLKGVDAFIFGTSIKKQNMNSHPTETLPPRQLSHRSPPPVPPGSALRGCSKRR